MRESFIKGKMSDLEQLFELVKRNAAGKLHKLVSSGQVSPNWRGAKGQTPLGEAAKAASAAAADVLLRAGADADAVEPDGETALTRAAGLGHLEMVKVLVTRKADVDKKNNDGLTALEIAQRAGHDAVVAFLSSQSAGSTKDIKIETSTNPDDDGPTTDSPGAASVPALAATAVSPEPRSYVQELDLEANPELETSPYFKAQQESEIVTGDGEEEAPSQSQSDGTEPAVESSGVGEQAESVWSAINSRHAPVLGKKKETRPALPDSVLAGNEEKIVFTKWDHQMVRSINQKTVKVLDKAGLELGDHTVDTVFKGSFLPVLKPRSQEYKRFSKLWKHPDLIIDYRRWREWTGAAAVRRFCLAEGKDVSPLSGSHLIELYSVKDLKLILTLAEDAITNNYTVRQLKRAIENLREGKDDADPGKVIIKTLDQSLPLLEEPDLMALCTDKDRVLEELSKAERKRIRALIKTRKPGLDEWKNLMDTLEGILSDLENE